MMSSLRHGARSWALVLPALLVTALVYRGVGDYAFVNFDDDLYVHANPQVTGGLAADGLRWALTTGHAGLWIPATWISFQVDAALFGPAAAGFHRTNLLLHLLNVVLVFVLGRRLTGSAAAGALAAALWGVHPLNVEAVAWVTARKDLLMTAFTLGAMSVWLRGAGSPRAAGWRRAGGTGLLIVLAMAAKPAAAVAPVLVLLAGATVAFGAAGAGPQPGAPRRPWAGLPIVALWFVAAATVAVVTWRLANAAAFGEAQPVALGRRLGDAAVAIVRYAQRLAWPHDLAVRYSDTDLRWTLTGAIAAAVAVAAVTGVAIRWRRRAPLAGLGWGWFVVGLLPSLGIVGGGQLPMGDRYAYLPAVGLFIAVGGWGAAAIRAARTRRRRSPAVALLVLAAAAVVAGAIGARRQAELWRDPQTLWRHALAVTRDNDVAHQNLAVLLDDQGRHEDARGHIDAALAIKPRSETLYNAGNIYAGLGRSAEAEDLYRRALQRNPALAEAALNLGSLLGAQGRLPQARQVLLEAEARRPDLAAVQFNLALIAWLQGDAAEARARCRRTLELDPAHAKARDLLAQIDAGGRGGFGN